MSYNKKVWKSGDRITKEALNNMENGIEAAHQNSGGTGSVAIVDNLNSDSSTSALSAKQGKELNNKMPAKSIVEGGKIYLAKEDGTKLDSGTELPAGGSTIEVVNNLESDSTTAALSAAQGKALNTQYKDIAKKTSIENGKLYLLKEDGTKIDTGTEIPKNSSSSASIQTYITEDIGELFPTPSNYTAWCPGNLIYDKNINKYVSIINAANQHVYTTLTRYICKIDPDTFITDKLISIEDKIKDSSNNAVTLDTSYAAICNFVLLDDGSYMFIAPVKGKQHRFISSDKGSTWTDNGEVTGLQYHIWAIYKTSNGRLICGYDYSKAGLCYSDNNGANWTSVVPTTCGGGYEAEPCILELESNKLMAIARYSSSGKGYNNSGDSEHAIISYSTDNGGTWTPWQISNTIDNMNAASCAGLVHDGIVEVFTTSRWYHNGDNANTDYTNTGKNGAIMHYTATIENALNDNFTKKGTIDYAKGEASEYHAPCIVKNTNNTDVLIMHMDGTSTSGQCVQRFIRGALDNLSYLSEDGSKSPAKSYSAKYIDILFENMLEKVNELQYALSQIKGSGVNAPSGTLIWTMKYIASEENESLGLASCTNTLRQYCTSSYNNNNTINCMTTYNDVAVAQTYILCAVIEPTKDNYAIYLKGRGGKVDGSGYSANGTLIGIVENGTFYGIDANNSLGNSDIREVKVVKNNGVIKIYLDNDEKNLSGKDITTVLGYTTIHSITGISDWSDKTYIICIPNPQYAIIEEMKYGEWDS